eukprot:856832-Pleurochrysis_carterae.AAC.5
MTNRTRARVRVRARKPVRPYVCTLTKPCVDARGRSHVDGGGSQSLLVIRLERLAHRMVHDESHVGLVDAKTKSNRRHHQLQLAALPRGLHTRNRGGFRTGFRTV